MLSAETKHESGDALMNSLSNINIKCKSNFSINFAGGDRECKIVCVKGLYKSMSVLAY